MQGYSLKSVLEKHKALFQPGLGTFKGHKVKIVVDHEAMPCFHKACPIPYAFKQKVEEELKHLVEEGALEAVEFCRLGSSYCASFEERPDQNLWQFQTDSQSRVKVGSISNSQDRRPLFHSGWRKDFFKG